MSDHNKAAAYHGVRNLKFAKKINGAYAEKAAMVSIPFAKNINLSSLLDAQEQYADDRMLFRVPSDKGYDGEVGTTAQDTNLEIAIGSMMETDKGVMEVSMSSYARGAFYYEFTEHDEDGVASQVKVWCFNCEVGRGAPTHTTDESTVAFGAYAYPIRLYGDKMMNAEGTAPYLDDKGIGRNVYRFISRPGDADYDTFGDSVPTCKMPASV